MNLPPKCQSSRVQAGAEVEEVVFNVQGGSRIVPGAGTLFLCNVHRSARGNTNQREEGIDSFPFNVGLEWVF